MDLIKDKNFIDKIEEKGDIIIALVMFALFASFVAYVFQGENPTTNDIPNYNEMIKNPYHEYEKMIENSKVKKLVKDEQFIEMKYNNNLSEFIKGSSPGVKEDPFGSNFDEK